MNTGFLLELVEAMPAPARDAAPSLQPSLQKRVSDKTISYTERHRGQWFKPEYDFVEIKNARKTDGYAFRSTQKKVNRAMVAGATWVGAKDENVKYIRQRVNEMEWATQKPWDELLEQTLLAMNEGSNCVWIKKRDAEKSSGKPRMHFGVELDPVAGYFIAAFETMEIKTKRNGEVKKWRQVMPGTADSKEYFPQDVIHFRTNLDPNFAVGTPELYPALDDIALLRRIEENVEDLIEANLFPVFHYRIGSDVLPEKYGPDGRSESQIVKDTLEYMPAGGIYVSDHRHEIQAVGSEGRALRIDFYLNYFKNRALASLGTTALDMGEGASANRSTASALSKNMLLDIEAMAKVVERYINFFVVKELLLEGGFDPMDPEEMVYLRFGVIDKEERRADENQAIQMFTNNLRTIDECRAALGDKPFTEEMLERTFFKMFGEPDALVKGMGPGSAAANTLAKHPSSNVTPEAVKKEETFTKQQIKIQKAAQAAGRPKTKKSGTSSNKARPANQHGRRSSPKTSRDVALQDFEGVEYVITCDSEIPADTIDAWCDEVMKRYESLSSRGVSLDTVIFNMLPRLEKQ